MSTIKLNPIKKNMTEVSLHHKTLLFSYEKLVAVYDGTPEVCTCYRTKEFFSKTTSKHLNEWCPENVQYVSQSELEKMAEL